MVPNHLHTTIQLLSRAFPDGIGADEYMPVLSVLYPHMADENLALVISEYTGRDIGLVLNDVLLAGSRTDELSNVEVLVRKKLLEAGVEQWARDDD